MWLCRTCPAHFSSGLAYVFRIELTCAYNLINLFARAVIAGLPSIHHCVVQSEEEDLAADSFHGQVSPIEMLHGAAAVASAESGYRIATSSTSASSVSTSTIRTTATVHHSDGWDLRGSACRADTPVHRHMSAITFLHQDGRCSLSHHHVVVAGDSSQNPIEVPGIDCLSSEVPERSARQTHAVRV
jgi:hypothetical protein